MEEEKTEPRPPVSTQEILQVTLCSKCVRHPLCIIYSSMHDLFFFICLNAGKFCNLLQSNHLKYQMTCSQLLFKHMSLYMLRYFFQCKLKLICCKILTLTLAQIGVIQDFCYILSTLHEHKLFTELVLLKFHTH